MNVREVISKYKPLIIVIILFLLVLSLRVEAANISAVPDSAKALYQDANGQPYFSEMDSYYNFRMTENYLNHGYLGDTKVNGTGWDLHSYFPPGKAATYSPLIVFITAFAYKFVNLFSHMPLSEVAFWIGAIIASLAVVPAYFFISRITNDYGGITAALLVALAPFYFSHTFAGFFDTDMFNMILPLFTVWFFVESFRTDNIKKRTIYTVLSVVFMLLFSLAWEGWIYIFYLLIFSTIVYLLVSNYLLGYKTIKKRLEYGSIKEWFINQPGIFTLVVFAVLSSILIVITSGASNFISSLLGPIGFTQLQESVRMATSYPNVYVSVGELQVPELLPAINNVGGIVVFVFALLGVFLLFLRLKLGKKEDKEVKKVEKVEKQPAQNKRSRKRRRRKGKQEAKEKKSNKKFVLSELKGPDKRNYLLYAILLTIWILTTAYALTKGVRFSEAFALPVAISAGIFVGLMLEYVGGYVKDNRLKVVVMAVLVGAAVFAPVVSGYSISQSVVPGTDDNMISSLNWIKSNTPQNTVITSWWDYGHLFTAVADRPVTFDGSSQNGPRAYWVGKALTTDNESLSVGILRMLSSSGDSGPNTIEVYTKDTGKSAAILTEILGVDKAAATNILTTKYGLTAEQAQNVTQYTHPDNPSPDVLITSSDMVGKAGWWTYFGNWNFQTNNTTSYSYMEGQAQVVPNNQTGLSDNTTVLIANNGVFVEVINNNITAGIINVYQLQNLQNQNITSQQLVSQLQTGLQGNNSSLIVKPHRLVVTVDGSVVQNQTVNDSGLYSIYIVNTNGTIMTYIMNKELEESMFTKLYILKGLGLTQYSLDYEKPGVLVWKVI